MEKEYTKFDFWGRILILPQSIKMKKKTSYINLWVTPQEKALLEEIPKRKMKNKEFNFRKELRTIYEKELLGRVTNCNRIYRKLVARDEEFIRLLKEDIHPNRHTVLSYTLYDWIESKINKLVGDKLIENEKQTK